jgi:hypothetical protein
MQQGAFSGSAKRPARSFSSLLLARSCTVDRWSQPPVRCVLTASQTFTPARALESLAAAVAAEQKKIQARRLSGETKAAAEAKSGVAALESVLAAAGGEAADSKMTPAQRLLFTVSRLANPQRAEVAASLKESLPSPAALGVVFASVCLLPCELLADRLMRRCSIAVCFLLS